MVIVLLPETFRLTYPYVIPINTLKRILET